jgi:hypothetical protein
LSDRERSRDLVGPGETDIAAPPLATPPPPLSLAQQIGRGAVAVAGVGFVLMTGLGIIGMVMQLATKGPGSVPILAFILSIGSAIGGVSMVRWALRAGHGSTAGAHGQLGAGPASAVPVRQLLLAVASAHGARITAAEVAAALTIEPTHALRMLDEATQAGDARVLFSPEGLAVYEVPGLLASKVDAKEPWQL